MQEVPHVKCEIQTINPNQKTSQFMKEQCFWFATTSLKHKILLRNVFDPRVQHFSAFLDLIQAHSFLE